MSSNPEGTPPDMDGIRSRLARIQPGLTEELFYAAARDGRYAAKRASDWHPPLTGPFNGHAETTATLRMRMAAFGWKVCNERGQPVTVRGDGEVVMFVSSGDENTGIAERQPSTNCVKGDCTRVAVQGNSIFDILPDGHPDKETWGSGSKVVRKPNSRTWILLVREVDDEVRMELSLPNEFGTKNRPDGWAERIIFPPMSTTNTESDAGDKPDDGIDFDVDVTRRVS